MPYIINKSRSYYYGTGIGKFFLGSGRGRLADWRTLYGDKLLRLVWVMTKVHTIVKTHPAERVKNCAFDLV